MPSRSLIALALITFISVAACVGITTPRMQSDDSEPLESTFVFPRLRDSTHEVTTIAVARRDAQFDIRREETGWVNDGLGGFPARDVHVEKTIEVLSNLVFLAPRTQRKRLHSKLGVEEISATAGSTLLTLNDTTGKELASVIVGKQKGDSDSREVYIRLPDNDRAWLARGSFDVNIDALSWSDTLVIDIPPTDIVYLAVAAAGQAAYALIPKSPASTDLTVADLAPESKVERQYQINYIAGAMETVNMLSARPDSLPESDSESECVLRAETRQGLLVTFDVREIAQDDSAWARISAATTDDINSGDKMVAEAARINKRFAGWQLRLPGKILARCRVRLSDIVGKV